MAASPSFKDSKQIHASSSSGVVSSRWDRHGFFHAQMMLPETHGLAVVHVWWDRRGLPNPPPHITSN